MASSLRTDEELVKIYNRHVDTVYRICFSFMKNAADTEDMVQETFLKLISCKKKFTSKEHEKAWLIVTASNTCKDEAARDRMLENIRSAMIRGSSFITTDYQFLRALKGTFQGTSLNLARRNLIVRMAVLCYHKYISKSAGEERETET